MKTMSADRGQFIGYPTNRVVGTVAEALKVGEAVGALLAAGFPRQDVEVLHGEEDLHRLDLTGDQHGFLAQVQRTVIRTFDLEEFKHLRHHVEDLQAGRFLIMVLAKSRHQRIVAADILHRFGGEFVGFYGRWAWEDLPAEPRTTPADFAELFARAWNARDADALASLFDMDADFVNESGKCWPGRDSIRRAHASRLQKLAGPSHLTADVPNVKQVSPEVAVVRVRLTLSGNGSDDPGNGSPSRSSIASFVVHRAGEQWLCASAHNTYLAAE